VQSNQGLSDTDLAVLPDEFSIRIEFLSDWHVGSGLGRPGDVDRLVLRDEDGLPLLPAKTLTGILRDAAERVAVGLDGGQPDSQTGWYAWVRHLFGDQPNLAAQRPEEPDEEAAQQGTDDDEAELVDAAPREAVLAIRPGRLPDDLRRCLRSPERQVLREALVSTKPGVTIDPQTRTAMDKHLRFEEMVRGGLVFEARAGWNGSRLPDAPSRAAATSLLVAAARLAERLGGKRRRGSGRVRITLPAAPDERCVADWIEQHPQAPPVPATANGSELNRDLAAGKVEVGSAASGSGSPAVAAPDAEEPAAGAHGNDPWVVFPLRIALETPVLIGRRTVGNVVEGLDFIPGTYFLPLLQRVLGGRVPDVAAAIQSGDVRIAPATIEIDGHRGLPVPAALHHPKVGGGFYARLSLSNGQTAGGVANLLRDEPGESSPYVKDYRRGYVGPLPRADRLPQYQQPKLVLRMHNTIKDDVQRPHEDVGGVYTYEAIAAGTVLRSELRVRQSLALDEQTLRDCFSRITYSLGRSKKDDYGLVVVSAVEVAAPAETEETLGAEGTGPTDPEQSQFAVWLTSDTLLRNEGLAAGTTCDALRVELERRLSRKLKVVQTGRRSQAFVRANRFESWQTGWGLPRPSLICLAAGSCAEFEVVEGGPIPVADLLELEREGLGERRAEGYGMLRVQDPLLDRPLLGRSPATKRGPTNTEAKFLSPGQEGFELARQLECTAWQRAIEQAASELVLDERFRREELGLDSGSKKPTSSQAAVVRGAVRRLRGPQDVHGLLAWLGHLAKLREKRWPKKALHCGRHDRQGQPQAAGRLIDLLTNPDEVWRLLCSDRWLVLTQGGSDRLRRELWAEAVRNVIDAALRIHQHELESHQQGDRGDGA
jgi:CRISPR-associated protein Csx10